MPCGLNKPYSQSPHFYTQRVSVIICWNRPPILKIDRGNFKNRKIWKIYGYWIFTCQMLSNHIKWKQLICSILDTNSFKFLVKIVKYGYGKVLNTKKQYCCISYRPAGWISTIIYHDSTIYIIDERAAPSVRFDNKLATPLVRFERYKLNL